MAQRWYVVKVQSGRENTVQAALERKLKVGGMTGAVPRVLVPVETVTEVKAGRKRTRKKKLYPGYVLVEVVQDERGKIPNEVWVLVRDTPGVGDFVGPYGNPDPLPQAEVDKLLLQAERSADKAPQVQMAFKKGDSVKIKEGPLESFDGVVDETIPAKGIVRVIVTIFGRATPVELEYWQVEPV
ncbi:MAG: transcription termination/antitermination factor NusG [Planctomycetes bacterium]|nr:transcription termination/antitermination factor NusG [Planctomycetota bacterium]